MTGNQFAVGDVVSDYEVLEELGRGEMGVAFRCNERTKQVICVVKAIHGHLASDPSFVKPFLREATKGAQAENAHIVAVHAVSQFKGSYFISRDYVAARSLAEIIEANAAFNIRPALDIVRQAAEAIRAAHKSGIVHAAIKPTNIFVDKEHHVQVSDFGLGRVVNVQTQLDEGAEPSGIHPYLSPEQCRGEDSDERSDIYSLGVVLYEMLAGERPFSSDAPEALVETIENDPFPSLSQRNESVPEHVVQFVERMTAKNPDDRFQSAEEIVRDLGMLLKGNVNAAAQQAAPVAKPKSPPVSAPATAETSKQGETPPSSGGPIIDAQTMSEILNQSATPRPKPAQPEPPGISRRGIVAIVLVVAASLALLTLVLGVFR